MKRLIICVMMFIVVSLTGCSTGMESGDLRYESSSADISDFSQEYDLVETLHMNRENMEYLNEDYEYRNWDSNYVFNGKLEEAILTLAKNSDDEYVIFVVPQNTEINVLVLNEFPYPSRTQMKSIVEQYNFNENGNIDTSYLETNEYFPNIKIAHFHDSIDEQIILGTLFIIFLGVDNDSGNDVFIGVDTEGDYVLLECDSDFENAEVIYSFSLD
jgi:hypothetical protein